MEDVILEKVNSCNIYNKKEGWIIEYPHYNELADKQMHVFWPWDEPKVENDVQDLRVKMTPEETHGILTTLKLFTLYEMHVGDDYWSGRIMKRFKRPEMQRMASMFSCVEFNSHAPFYNRINELLFLDTEEFYSSWKQSPTLRNRMEFIDKYASHKNDLISAAAFSFIEGAVLYSSFAFVKHFQSQDCGKDLIKNVCRGVDQSVGDENMHAMGGAMLFRDLYKESNFTEEEKSYIYEMICSIAREVYLHEEEIIDITFGDDNISGVKKATI